MEKIKAALQRNCEQTKPNFDSEVDELFQKYYNEWKAAESPSLKESYSKIPKFHFKMPNPENAMQLKLREEARISLYQERSASFLDDKDLKSLWRLLDQNHTCLKNGDEKMISYEDFLKVKKLVKSKCLEFFNAQLFAKLQQNDPLAHISIMDFFNYAMRKAWLDQTRIGLSVYDSSGQGYLREAELENYILDLIPTLPQLEGLETSFYCFYVCTAVRKFFFFLDPLRTGRIRIIDILICKFLDDLLELRDECLSKDVQEQNWFSATSALRVYGQYLNLDKDHNGMLNKDELAGYGSKTLTNTFLERLFQECMTFDGEMDYKNYLDFVLALENRYEPQSLRYFFKVLDIDAKGYLNAADINYFFRAIQEQAGASSEMVSVEDVITDIFDMIKPVDPEKITLHDLLNSHQGSTAVNILIDYHGFWAFENRESMSTEPSSSMSSSFHIADTEPDMATEFMSQVAHQI